VQYNNIYLAINNCQLSATDNCQIEYIGQEKLNQAKIIIPQRRGAWFAWLTTDCDK